jgi:hypothetical protein
MVLKVLPVVRLSETDQYLLANIRMHDKYSSDYLLNQFAVD